MNRLPDRAPPVTYKKPSALNAVSLTLLLLVAVAGWVAYSAWPAFALKAQVKGELQDALVLLYRANLKPEPVATQETLMLKRNVYDMVRRAGVTDKQLEVKLTRSKQLVAIEARFSSVVQLKGTSKRFTWSHAPRVETDAARVDW